MMPLRRCLIVMDFTRRRSMLPSIKGGKAPLHDDGDIAAGGAGNLKSKWVHDIKVESLA